MTRAVRALAIILVAGLVAAACTGTRATPKIQYYVLAVPNGDTPALATPVRVDDFSIDDPYATRQLAYRMSPYRLAYYNFHRWAGSPEVVVASAAREYLEHGNTDAEGAPFEIGARVRRIEEIDDDDRWSGALTIEFTVRREGVVVLERSYSETERAARRNPEAVVAALSRALKRILQALAADLSAPATATP